MAAAVPNGNGNHHLQDDVELNPANHLLPNDIDRVMERSLIRQIRVLGDTVRRLQRRFTFTQANNPGPAALLRINERINDRANGRRSTLYAQLHTYIRRRRRLEEEQQQQQAPPPPGNNSNSNGNGNGTVNNGNSSNAAAGAPPADA